MEVPPGTLQHRTAFADENQRAGRCASERAGRLWLIDPHAASELLKEYDGGTGHIVKDDTKRTGLLKSSLTQSDGPDWRRQRAAVVAAVGGGQVAQFTRHRAAACRAGELAASVIADHTARSPQRVMVHPDVMDLARMVAARGIVAAVVGDGDGDANAAAEAARIEVVLSAFMKVSSAAPSLSLSFPLISSHFLSFPLILFTSAHEANRRRKEQKDEAVVQSLGSELQRGILALLEHHSKHESSTSSAATALLARLMSRPELSKEEVIGNANSCLLAGVETTSLLIGCSLLRLACRPALRIAARAEIRASSSSGDATQRSKLVGAIMRETLRVHPPVLGACGTASSSARCMRDC